jgi:hypothetical protein
MTVAYLVVVAVGLPVVLYGQRADRVSRTGADPRTIALRGGGAALLFGGLTGLALSLLEVHPAAVAGAAAAMGAGAAYLRARIIQFGVAADTALPAAVEGRLATVVDEVGGQTTGRIVVEAAGERWHLEAVPFGTSHFAPGRQVVVVALRDGTALVAAPEEVGR